MMPRTCGVTCRPCLVTVMVFHPCFRRAAICVGDGRRRPFLGTGPRRQPFRRRPLGKAYKAASRRIRLTRLTPLGNPLTIFRVAYWPSAATRIRTPGKAWAAWQTILAAKTCRVAKGAIPTPAPAMLLGTQALDARGLVRFWIREAFWRRFRAA
jgi:hypothetical protein